MKAWDAYRPKEFGMGVRDFFLIFNVKLRVVIFPVKKIRGQGGSISTLRRPDLVRDQLLANRSSSCEEEEEEEEGANPATLVKETKPQETRIPSSSAAPPRLILHLTTPKPPPRNLQQQEEITNLTAASPSHNSLDAALEAASSEAESEANLPQISRPNIRWKALVAGNQRKATGAMSKARCSAAQGS
ncbi:unnamed protein product [Sphagnum troendelagicum]